MTDTKLIKRLWKSKAIVKNGFTRYIQLGLFWGFTGGLHSDFFSSEALLLSPVEELAFKIR